MEANAAVSAPARDERPAAVAAAGLGTGELVAVWLLFAVQATATLLTYSRLPPSAVYNVDESGDLLAGLGRTLTLLNYPLSLGAIALVALAGGPRLLVWGAIALCSLTAVPGVVDQGDLDGRPVNVLPALGVAIAVALTIRAARSRGLAFAPGAHGDGLRLAIALVLLVAALPWAAAEAGFYFPGDVFMGEEVPPVRDEGVAAVHRGFHHGTGGVLLALAALALSRVPTASRGIRAYLSLMLAYGVANASQDSWNEQLWKRGWVDVHVPSMIRPSLTAGWLVLLLGAGAVYAWWFHPDPEP
ncbi:MAG: hypothetical protein ACM33B_10115 [Pseudomonadota bacterium]